jgi:hypothetical protein
MSFVRRVIFPPSLNIEGAIGICATLRSLTAPRPILFDFANLGYVSPFAMILVSSVIKETIDRLPAGFCQASGHLKKSYLAHMGFFRASGIDFGNQPGTATGSGRYLPVTDLDCNELYKLSAQGGIALGELVEEQAQRVAAVLAQAVDGDLHDTLAYSIREMMRNTLEHSQSRILRYCAQYWPSQDRVEVGILDHGRGIKASLSRNPHLECETDRAAITYALMPGVSGTAFKGAKRNRKDIWQNSGYGLYMTSRICRLGGDFFIGSHTAAIHLDAKSKDHLNFNFQGTGIGMTIRPSQTANLQSRLKLFSEEGREIGARITGVTLKASTASQMLTVDFRQQ